MGLAGFSALANFFVIRTDPATRPVLGSERLGSRCGLGRDEVDLVNRVECHGAVERGQPSRRAAQDSRIPERVIDQMTKIARAMMSNDQNG
jgi:hypothetical protein